MKYEPKSIHTYFDSDILGIYACEVDIRVTKFPESADQTWLYYFAFSVNFTCRNEWSHGGFQWSGIHEFKTSGNKGINWGGDSNQSECGGINNKPYVWGCNKWYHYNIRRIDPENNQQKHYRWLFTVLDYNTGEEIECGYVFMKSPYIVCRNTMVFTETGYGVRCDSPKIRVEWRNPIFITPDGQFGPKRIVANYNSTCVNPTNTNQNLISDSPLCWFHETNTIRTTLPNTNLWPI